ncbi:MAG: DUF2007 domain-containing protein [Anaerolineae bacterium]|nr:MAG: DUF2007 domain-containing protein [Anaerolineae bacterium]
MTNTQKWRVAARISGEGSAEILRGLLEAQGIPVHLAREGAARAIGVEIGPFGLIEVMVPQERLTEARQVLAAFQRGDFEHTDE